ncbi:hypothetical protein MKW94_024797 [Papaver nudicaule]|uniref:LOB domain-containing protein n=1 Tax=Papaver nudicaule TaxID=74823 RepID=A0AA41VTS0_PAPNU|nr:hypothetical protein [Papaver nudicaule]
MMMSNGSSSSSSNGGNGPCGACKFLRRKCVKGCIFAPYFNSEEGSTHFAAVHKIFGASNVSKLLLRLPAHKRLDAVVTISYEALSRIRDPVYGCVGHIFALQQQVVNLQAELAYVQAHLSTLELTSHQEHSFISSPTPSSALTTVHASSDMLSSETSNMSTLLASFQSQHQQSNGTPTMLDTRRYCSPPTVAAQNQQHQQNMYNVDGDGDLQTLAREFLSKYFPESAKFQTSNYW